jgi:hypothetical protein
LTPTFVRRTLTVVATTGTAATLALAGSAVSAHAATGGFVSVGDSYASGVGAGDYTSSSGSCDRSTNAAAYLWDNANSPSSFSFEACSGATTTDVLDNQLGALNSSTSLVSVIVGGDDVGFTSVMEDCILDGTSTCESDVSSAETEARNDLPAKLDTLYSAIRADAPNAHIVVIGYPEFYDLSQSGSCVGLSTGSRTAIDGGADVLDSVIQTQAADYGFSFVDVRPYFSGHEICDSTSYLNSVDLFSISSSYHPTASGQADAYYPALEAGVAQ